MPEEEPIGEPDDVGEPEDAAGETDLQGGSQSDGSEDVADGTPRDINGVEGPPPKIDLGVAFPGINSVIKAAMPSMPSFYDVIRSMNEYTMAPFQKLSFFMNSQPSSLAWWLPMIQSNAAAQRHLTAINADLLKAAKLPQFQLGLLGNHLAKNVDFGLGSGFDQIAKQFVSTESSWLTRLGPIIANLDFRIYPDNLEAIEDLTIREVQAVVMLDGIALYGVPRASIAQAIIRAESSAQRRRIMGRQWVRIVADCRAALATCEAPDLAAEVHQTMAAIEALEAGHTQASQALVGSVLDTLVAGYFGQDRYNFTPNHKTKNSDAYKSMHVRKYIAFAPVWQAYQQFHVEKGDPVPFTFSRHATAHTVSGRQYSRVNTVQALMIAGGILLFREGEESQKRAA